MVSELLDQEILNISPLGERDAALLDHHSLLNVLNVLYGELCILGMTLEGNPDHLVIPLNLCRDLISSLSDPGAALRSAARTDAAASVILAEVGLLRSRHPDRVGDPELEASEENIRSVLRVWSVRAQDILARSRHPMRWEKMSVAKLAESFRVVFEAIALNSRGRFHFVKDPLKADPNSYHVDLRFVARDGEFIEMPPVLVDVMRDLLANARKYTPPGGSILGHLTEEDGELTLLVEDTGRGIPEEEVKSVVEFGVRGSNAGEVRPMGGGFGLTKAFLVTRRFGGRFWIASRLGVGTRVRVCLPRPRTSWREGTGNRGAACERGVSQACLQESR